MANECDRKRKELSDELATELSYLSLDNNARVNIQLDSTTAWGQNISTVYCSSRQATTKVRVLPKASILFRESPAKL